MSVVLLDNEPLLRQERIRCYKLRQQVDAAVEKLRGFNQYAQGAFSTWLAATFGAELTELREQGRKALELESLVAEISTEMRYSRCSPQQAYKRVMAERELIEEAEAAPEFDFDSSHRGEYRDGEGDGDDDDPSTWNEIPEPPGSRDDNNDWDEQPGEGEPDRAPRPGENRLKELYRSLARKLHPDSNPDLTAEQRELWHQVQDAYDSGDLARLEALSAFGQQDESGLENIDQISLLREIAATLARRKRAIESELRAARRDRAWDFDKVIADEQRLKRFEAGIRRELDDEALQIRLELLRLEKWIARCAHPAKASARKEEASERHQGRRSAHTKKKGRGKHARR